MNSNIRVINETEADVIGKETQDKIAELKVKYETAAKEKELISLKQENKIRIQIKQKEQNLQCSIQLDK